MSTKDEAEVDMVAMRQAARRKAEAEGRAREIEAARAALAALSPSTGEKG